MSKEIPTEWMKEFMSYMPKGCAIPIGAEEWIKEQYQNGLEPDEAYSLCKIIYF